MTKYSNKAVAVLSPMQSAVVAINVTVGQSVEAGQDIAIVEAMKMQHAVKAPISGLVTELLVAPSQMVDESQSLLLIKPAESGSPAAEKDTKLGNEPRVDLQRLEERIAITLDAARSEAVKKRHDRGWRTARENIDDLCDRDSFQEYGQLIYAAQRRKTDKTVLMNKTPADGVIAGFAAINGDLFDASRTQVAVLSYDATVMAGTQGGHGHKKTDRILELAAKSALPLVFFTEGGGGRPGDDDFADIVGSTLDCKTFLQLARYPISVPRIAINCGYCFAGNAVIFGSCDFKLATTDSWIGMGGPAMIEGGGLASCAAEDVGPAPMQAKLGLVDILVESEAEAVSAAKQLLGFYQGENCDWKAPDQQPLRDIIPEDRKRAYDMYALIEMLADSGSWLELKSLFAPGMITGLLRIEGKPIGVIANNPHQLGGAIDAACSQKATEFIALCDSFNIPLLSVCDTPGFMVGPDSEEQGAVMQAGKFINRAARAKVPHLMVCVRRGFGLGAMAMAGGSFVAPQFVVAWPSSEFGAMGIEGAVKLGYKKELANETDPAKREILFKQLVDRTVEAGSAIEVASLMELDAVIDPADTRKWIVHGLSLSAERSG